MSIAFHFPSEQYDDDDDDDDDEWLWFNMNLLICGYDDCEKKFKVVLISMVNIHRQTQYFYTPRTHVNTHHITYKRVCVCVCVKHDTGFMELPTSIDISVRMMRQSPVKQSTSTSEDAAPCE
jgi:hypothetical protein